MRGTRLSVRDRGFERFISSIWDACVKSVAVIGVDFQRRDERREERGHDRYSVVVRGVRRVSFPFASRKSGGGDRRRRNAVAKRYPHGWKRGDTRGCPISVVERRSHVSSQAELLTQLLQ